VRRPSTKEVAIVSGNPETIDGLENYLATVGFVVRTSHELVRWKELTSKKTEALVLFPDDYDAKKVASAVTDFATHRPAMAAILVTARPQLYRSVKTEHEIVLVPRPAWSWTILDAIRAHAQAWGR
jgi:hypothetical protein